MSLYLFLLFGSTVLGIFLCGKKLEPFGKPIYCAVTGITFILVSALRFSTGTDYNMYATIFHNYTFKSIEEVGLDRIEKGFSIPMYILNNYSDTYIPFFIVTSIVIYLGVFLYIYKFSSLPWTSVAVFLSFGVFFNSLNFLRQFVAAIVVAFAIKYIEEKKLLRYIVCILIASVFHWSALIMLPFYLILQIKPNKLVISFYILAIVLIYIFSMSIMEFVTGNIFIYSGYDPKSNVEMMTGLPIKYSIMFLIPLIISLIFKKRLEDLNPRNIIYINCLLFVVFFELIGAKHGIISRVALLFFLPGLLTLLPDLLLVIKEFIDDKFKEKKLSIKIISSFIGASSLLACYLMLILSNYNQSFPYKSIINMDPSDYYTQSDESIDIDDSINEEDNQYIDNKTEDSNLIDEGEQNYNDQIDEINNNEISVDETDDNDVIIEDDQYSNNQSDSTEINDTINEDNLHNDNQTDQNILVNEADFDVDNQTESDNSINDFVSDEDFNIEDYYVDWDNYDWDEVLWD